MPDGVFDVVGVHFFIRGELLGAVFIFAGVIEYDAASPVARELVRHGREELVEVGKRLLDFSNLEIRASALIEGADVVGIETQSNGEILHGLGMLTHRVEKSTAREMASTAFGFHFNRF